MKNYRVVLNIKISDKDRICDGHFHHEVAFIVPMQKNKLAAINSAISCIDCVVDSSIEREIINRRIGRDYKVKTYQLDKIISCEVYKDYCGY